MKQTCAFHNLKPSTHQISELTHKPQQAPNFNKPERQNTYTLNINSPET